MRLWRCKVCCVHSSIAETRWKIYARVWTPRLSGAHYGPETATSPEISRLLLAKPLASLELIDDFIEMISSSHLNDQSALSERSNHD